MRAPLALLLLALAAAGCGTASRKPLFSFEPSPPRPRPTPRPEQPAPLQPIAAQPTPLRPPPASFVPDPASVPSASATREEIESLVARLRGGKTGERKQVLDRLVQLGEPARGDLERALEDATFEGDVLAEALARIREKIGAPRPASEGPGADGKKGVASPWVEAKYRLALEKFLAGDDLGAQQLVEAILTVEPATTARPKLERLRRKIRDHLIAQTVIASTLVLDEKVVTAGRALHAKIVLENKTREDVTLKAAPGSPLGQVVLDYEELRPDGTRALRRTTRPVKVAAAGLRLDAHAKQELAVDLPNEHATKARGIVGRYRLSGRLRPFTLLAGEEPLPYFLPVDLVEVVVLDEEDRALADKPAESFAKSLKDIPRAVEARSEADLERALHAGFASALVWASQDREAAVRAIVAALEDAEGAPARMLGAALGRAVGEPGTYTKEEWLAWWKMDQSRPRSGHGGEDDEEGPPPIKVPR